MLVGKATVENSTKVPQKPKNRVTIWSSHPTLGRISKQNCSLERYVKAYVHNSTIHNSQDMETA